MGVMSAASCIKAPNRKKYHGDLPHLCLWLATVKAESLRDGSRDIALKEPFVNR
jgi:hypothetical protein